MNPQGYEGTIHVTTMGHKRLVCLKCAEGLHTEGPPIVHPMQPNRDDYKTARGHLRGVEAAFSCKECGQPLKPIGEDNPCTNK